MVLAAVLQTTLYYGTLSFHAYSVGAVGRLLRVVGSWLARRHAGNRPMHTHPACTTARASRGTPAPAAPIPPAGPTFASVATAARPPRHTTPAPILSPRDQRESREERRTARGVASSIVDAVEAYMVTPSDDASDVRLPAVLFAALRRSSTRIRAGRARKPLRVHSSRRPEARECLALRDSRGFARGEVGGRRRMRANTRYPDEGERCYTLTWLVLGSREGISHNILSSL